MECTKVQVKCGEQWRWVHAIHAHLTSPSLTDNVREAMDASAEWLRRVYPHLEMREVRLLELAGPEKVSDQPGPEPEISPRPADPPARPKAPAPRPKTPTRLPAGRVEEMAREAAARRRETQRTIDEFREAFAPRKSAHGR